MGLRACTFLYQNKEFCTECGISIDLCLCLDVSRIAQERVFTREGKFLKRLLQEVERARENFPENQAMMAALMEEVGELAQALIEHDRRGSEEIPESEILAEAVQVAAMALRVALEGDQSFSYNPLYNSLLEVNQDV